MTTAWYSILRKKISSNTLRFTINSKRQWMTCFQSWWQNWEWPRNSSWWLVRKRQRTLYIKRSLIRLLPSTTSSLSRDSWSSATQSWTSKLSRCSQAKLSSHSHSPAKSRRLLVDRTQYQLHLHSKPRRSKLLRKWLRLKRGLRKSLWNKQWRCLWEKSRRRKSR